MEDNNKPDWLKQYEEQAKEFNESKIGSMSQKEFEIYERVTKAAKAVKHETQVKAGKIGGQKNVESGHWDSLKTKEHQSKASLAGHESKLKSGYYQSEKHKNAARAGGYKTGKINGRKCVESGHLDRIREKAKKSVKEIVTCPVCGDQGGRAAMKGHHFDNCKTLKLYNALPDGIFSKKEVLHIFEELNVGWCRVLRDSKRYEIIGRKIKKKGIE